MISVELLKRPSPLKSAHHLESSCSFVTHRVSRVGPAASRYLNLEQKRETIWLDFGIHFNEQIRAEIREDQLVRSRNPSHSDVYTGHFRPKKLEKRSVVSLRTYLRADSARTGTSGTASAFAVIAPSPRPPPRHTHAHAHTEKCILHSSEFHLFQYFVSLHLRKSIRSLLQSSNLFGIHPKS